MMSIIKKLQKVNSEYAHASQIRNQARSLSLLSSGIYTEAERFVYELLQNAIDAFVDVDSDRLSIRIDIIGDYFVFMHNGAAFSDSDIEGLCSVGNGNKGKSAKKVGYKGIGFKAVFMQSSLVYIQSGKDCCFKFDKEACFDLLPEDLKAELKRDNVPLYDDVPWQIIPIASNPPLELDTNDFNVVFFIKMTRLAELLPKIEKLLKDKEFLLFLNAKYVSVSLFNHSKLITSISRATDGEVVELAVNKAVQSRWIMHSEAVAITEEVRDYISQNVSSVPEKLREADQIEVTFSIKIGDDREFVPLQNSVVYTYLPTSYGSLNLPYLINANFLTDAGRQQLQQDSEWNKLIFRETPKLFLKWISTLSHSHPEYYKILPKRHPRLFDELSGIFFSSLSDAIKEVAFLPSVRVSDKTVLVSDAYIDRIGLSKVFGVERFLSCANKCFNRSYDEDGEVADVDGAILSEYGVKIFASREVLQLLMDGRILADITADENFKLVEFLREQITSHEEIEDLGPVAFLLDDTNRLCVARDLCLPSEFKSQNAPAKDVRTLNERLYEILKDKEELRWLRVNFGIKEMSNFGFVEYILDHPDYVTIDNAISLGRFLFRAWKKENFLDRSDVAEKMKRVMFLTNTGELKPIVNLYLGSKYRPQHDLEKVVPDLGMYISPEYPEDNDCLEDWSFFMKKCGASDSVGITQRILNAESITDKRKDAEELKAYPILEEAAVAFYSKRHEKSNYYHFLNPIIKKQIAVSYFTFVDPSRRGAGELERYVLNIGLSQQFQREAIEDKISGKVHYWGIPKEDSLFSLVASRYKTFMEYALGEKQLFPTVMGTSQPAKEVFINNSKITRLAGRYLPVLDISNTVHDSWKKFLAFKETLTLDDYLTLLANIANDTENAKNNRDRVSSIYQELIDAKYSTNEKVKIREWGRTHKILSINNEYLQPSDLSYITIEGFKCATQAYGKVESHYLDQVVDLLRTFGVCIIDKVTPEFSDCKESKGFKDKLLRNIAYIALIRSCHVKSDYDECVKEIKKQIDGCAFYQCKKIELSYGDKEDKISRVTYADAEVMRFYYVGELCPSKMELLTKPLCKYLRLGYKERELLVVLISKTCTELDEYFADKGYAEGLLNKVKQVVASQGGLLGVDLAGVSKGLESGVDQTAESDDGVASPESEKQPYKIGEYDVDEDEYSQLSQIFAGGATSDDADAEKKQDESKLACLRLFNYLQRLELQPSMDGHTDSQYIVKNLYAKFKKLGPNLDLKDGRTIHVISAMGGIAYLPPYWWDKVVKDPRAEICAVAGAREEDFCFIRNRDDLLEKIGDNAVPVKIRGHNHEERASLVESWFGRVQTSETATKIYALLKVKVKTRMDGAFEKGICNDEMGHEEEENGYDEYN